MRLRSKYAGVFGLALCLLATGVDGNAAEGPGRAKEIGVVPGAQAPLAITVKADRESGRYRLGERVVFQVEASRDCYLTLLNIGTSGQVKVLYPNPFQPMNLLRAGQAHRFPGPDGLFEFPLIGPPGTEGVVAICAIDAGSMVAAQISAGPPAGEISVAVQVTTKDVGVAPAPQSRERWAIATLALEVEPAGQAR